MAGGIEIVCTACGADALLRREPVYEGFRKTGERLQCAACGHVYASEAEVPFRATRRAAVFTDADKSRVVDPFAHDPRQRNCRYCAHYTVNPFTQWCSLHRRDVLATDTCERFERKPDSAAGGAPRAAAPVKHKLPGE